MAGHIYETPIGKLPSVTTILALKDKSNVLMPWAAKCVITYLAKEIGKGTELVLTEENSGKILYAAKNYYKTIQEEALDNGSQVHFLIEGYIKAKLANEPPLTPDWSKYKAEVRNGFEAFLEWEQEHKVQWVASELSVWHKKGYAGTLDAVAVVDGILMVCDWKTSKGIYWGYLEQIAAYKKAYEQMTKQKVKGVGCLRLDKETGMPEWKSTHDKTKAKKERWSIKDVNVAFKKFECLLKLYKLENQNKKESKNESR